MEALPIICIKCQDRAMFGDLTVTGQHLDDCRVSLRPYCAFHNPAIGSTFLLPMDMPQARQLGRGDTSDPGL
jgi:hypothetical protein